MSIDLSTQDDRSRRAAKIIENPANYKVCEGCDSIVATRAVTCPNCEAYRFDTDPAAVVLQAQCLAGRERRSVTAEDLFA